MRLALTFTIHTHQIQIKFASRAPPCTIWIRFATYRRTFLTFRIFPMFDFNLSALRTPSPNGICFTSLCGVRVKVWKRRSGSYHTVLSPLDHHCHCPHRPPSLSQPPSTSTATTFALTAPSIIACSSPAWSRTQYDHHHLYHHRRHRSSLSFDYLFIYHRHHGYHRVHQHPPPSTFLSSSRSLSSVSYTHLTLPTKRIV